MITGERIKSRSDHRAHLRSHGCIEVGNEKMETKLPKQDRTENKARLRRQLAGMSDSQAVHLLTEIHNRYGR